MGTAGYREAEEGLAVYFEHQLGHLYPFQEKIYAGRCLAVHLSLFAGFADVFEELLVYFDQNTAYSIVERIKRGQSDTSRPGALTNGHRHCRATVHAGIALALLVGVHHTGDITNAATNTPLICIIC